LSLRQKQFFTLNPKVMKRHRRQNFRWEVSDLNQNEKPEMASRPEVPNTDFQAQYESISEDEYGVQEDDLNDDEHPVTTERSNATSNRNLADEKELNLEESASEVEMDPDELRKAYKRVKTEKKEALMIAAREAAKTKKALMIAAREAAKKDEARMIAAREAAEKDEALMIAAREAAEKKKAVQALSQMEAELAKANRRRRVISMISDTHKAVANRFKNRSKFVEDLTELEPCSQQQVTDSWKRWHNKKGRKADMGFPNTKVEVDVQNYS
jgi:hypothetical protein